MAVEQRAADAAVEDVVERGVVRLGRPGADELVAFLEAADAQPFVIGRPAAEAAIVRRVGFLDALFAHRFLCEGDDIATTSGKNASKRRCSSARESSR